MLTEKQLITRLKSGDVDALKLLMQKYQDFVYTLALQMVKSKQVAEELTQDVFIKVFKKINTFAEKSKFSTWLYTITYRSSLNYLEKKQIVFNLSELEHENNSDGNEILANNIDDAEENYTFEESEKQKILWSAIDRLPVQQGSIIMLHYLQQFSIREISEMMTIPASTVKTHLFRGRGLLKSILLKNYSQEELL
ncbi:MAG: RNA polymerase sigma factor [Calditrichaeota bacterium]|nr:MAG: RNA polymerase sigma factor [Calditrichota bacterium]MBL1207853.1 RNA polymerase sigma factor [Calditrichota bacterium]NOG47687.1 RNA polymerase sigma factor [Calditrichota bacterium]